MEKLHEHEDDPGRSVTPQDEIVTEGSPANPYIGRVISHYRILAPLGSGGMGAVYKAEDTKLNRVVALKFISDILRTSPVERARFLREAQAASCINHPNVCTVYEIGECEAEAFIAMEFVEGRTLTSWLSTEIRSRGELSTHDAVHILNIATQIADGLEKAHERNVVHRDVKSENIMVTTEGWVKILDFGLAQLRGATVLTKTGTTLGTLAYMSPEQVQGEHTDHRTDIFSLGVLLYQMISGEMPFRGEHVAELIYQIVNVDPPPLHGRGKGIDARLDQTVRRCLQKKVDQRYQSMREVLVDLTQCQKDLEEQVGREGAVSAGTIERHRRLGRLMFSRFNSLANEHRFLRSPWMFTGAGLLLLAVLAALIFHPWKNRAVAFLSVESAPGECTVRLNDEPIGTTPLERYPAAPGSAVLRFDREDYSPRETTIVLDPGMPRRVYVELTRLAPSARENASTALSNDSSTVGPTGEPVDGMIPRRSATKVAEIRSPEELAKYLATSFQRKVGLIKENVLVTPFTLEDTQIGGSFSFYLRQLLENHLAEIAKWPIVQQGTPDTRARNVDQAMMEASHATYLVSGTYWKQRNGIRFVAKLTRGGDFRLIANADAFVNIDILAGSNLSISPRNVIQAISDQKTFSKGKPAISQLRLDVWTDKGDKNLVIEEGQRLSIYVRTNMACYLRLIYILADGRRALIQSRGRITEDEMNQALLVKTLECAPPFGAEVLCAFARTTPFEPVETIEQGDYRILRNNLADVLNTTRGLKSIHEEVLQAEARLVITTVEKRQP